MKFRGNSWLLVLLAAAVAAAIYGVLYWGRVASDPPLSEVLHRFPPSDAVTIHVDLAALRRAHMGGWLEGAAAMEEPEYRRFVTEIGFDWKTDLDWVTAAKTGEDWYFIARGRFELDKLRSYAIARGGGCRNGVCDAPSATPGRRVSFYPLTPRVLAVSTSKGTMTVRNLETKRKADWAGGVPEGPLWVSFNGSVLAGDPALPSGGRLFGKVLSETERTTFSVNGGAEGLVLTMRAICKDTSSAGNVKAQLEGVTKEFKNYFERLGQPANTGDLSGLLLAGQFATTGSDVTGRWPLHADLLKRLAGGTL